VPFGSRRDSLLAFGLAWGDVIHAHTHTHIIHTHTHAHTHICSDTLHAIGLAWGDVRAVCTV
jgi:hypothetical protein